MNWLEQNQNRFEQREKLYRGGSQMQRLTEYYDGEARAIRIDHKKAFAKLAAYEDTELTPEDVAEMKLELIAARSRLIDMEKALKLACIRLSEEMGAHPKGGRNEFWKEHFIQEARGGNETSDIQNRQQ
jgi:hypothetical protein